jgi:trk system potassium uptake protein TrkA
MRVVIAGGGSVGSAIAADLKHNGHSVQVLESDPDRVEVLRGSLPGVEVVACDACEVSSLQAAGLRQAEVVVAATGDDEDNLVISWLSKQEFAVPRVISRVNNAGNAWLFNETWGVDVSVSTPQLLAALVEEAVAVGAVVRLMDLDRAGATLVEVTLDENAPAIEGDRTLADLALPADARVVAIVRDEIVVAPRDETRLSAGDHVIVLTTRGAESEISRVFVGE